MSKEPEGLDPLRVAAASDNLSDGWRTVVNSNNFPAEKVTRHVADFDDAPSSYAEHASKLVLQRPALIQN